MAKKRSSGTGMGVLAVFGVVAVVAGLAVLVAVRAQNKPQTRVVKGVLTAGHAPLRVSPPLAKRGVDLGRSGDPLLADVNGDHVDELIVYEGSAYAAIDTRHATVVWRTPAIAPPSAFDAGHFAWVTGSTASPGPRGPSLVVSRGLDVSVFALDRGTLRATFQLPERITRPCASASPVLARVSLPKGDLDLLSNNERRKATGECLAVDTDGFDIAKRGSVNGRAHACAEGTPACGGLPAMPDGFIPLELQLSEPVRTALGVKDADGQLLGIDRKKLLWSTSLIGPIPPPGLRANGTGDFPNDPAFLGWRAGGDLVLVFRSYYSTYDSSVFQTSIEGLSATGGKRVFLAWVNGYLTGVRYRDPIWVVTTPTSAWELTTSGSVRLLTGGPSDPFAAD